VCKITFRISNWINDLVSDENKTNMRLQLRRCIYAPPTSIFFKWNLIAKGLAASALEVAGPQHKKVWEALV